MKIWPKKCNQSGDTIVEVLIALAVISSVLAGAFLVSQSSTRAVRDGQEHAEMLQLLQGQVEIIRSMAFAETDPTAGIFATSPKYFCVNGNDPAQPVRVQFPTSFSLGSISDDNYIDYPTECKNIQQNYNIVGSYDDTTHVFRLHGRWDKIGGGKNEEILSYRAYAGTPVAPTP